MNIWKKIANGNWEETGCAKTRYVSKHGLDKAGVKLKRITNRRAKKLDARWHFGSQESA